MPDKIYDHKKRHKEKILFESYPIIFFYQLKLSFFTKKYWFDNPLSWAQELHPALPRVSGAPLWGENPYKTLVLTQNQNSSTIHCFYQLKS